MTVDQFPLKTMDPVSSRFPWAETAGVSLQLTFDVALPEREDFPNLVDGTSRLCPTGPVASPGGAKGPSRTAAEVLSGVAWPLCCPRQAFAGPLCLI